MEGGHSESRILAIHGLSGVGKTQLCREYVEIHRADYDLTYWISATDKVQATSDLAQLAADLELPGFDLQDSVRSSRVALQWLEQNDSWLLVFDNAAPHIVGSLLPSSGSGHILISSNDPNWSSITNNKLRLRGLSPEDAVQFLLQRTGLPDSPLAARIVNAFDCLPLALEQAAAYIETAGIDFDTYERLLAQHRPVLLDERSPFTEYPESVYSALRLNVESVSDRTAEVVVLLRFVAHVNPSGIPRGLVSDAVHNYFYQMDMHFDDVVFNRLVSELARVSLIVAEDNLISTHPLVQAFVRDSLQAEDQIGWSRFVLSVLAHTFPNEVDDSSNWPQCESLIDHVTTAITLADYQSWDDESIEVLYNNAGLYLHTRDQQDKAYQLLSKALDQSTSRLGKEHPQVALALNNLLGVLAALDRSNEALNLGERALEILNRDQKTREKYAIHLGKLYSNLGRISLHSEKDFQAARLGLGRALSIHTSRLGENHMTTAIDINNIGTVYREEGKWTEAYGYFQKAVRIHRKALPSTDYRLAIALYNLGTAAYNLERYAEAWIYLHEAVEIYDVLRGGAKGWDQMDALAGLGQTLRNLGRPREALPYFDRAIQIGEDLLGRETPRMKSIISLRGAAAFDVIRPFFCYFSKDSSPAIRSMASW